MHEHNTLTSEQAKKAGGREDKVCLNISFSTAGGEGGGVLDLLHSSAIHQGVSLGYETRLPG